MPKIVAASRRHHPDNLSAAIIVRRSTAFKGKKAAISCSRRRSISTLFSISIRASQIDDCSHVESLKLPYDGDLIRGPIADIGSLLDANQLKSVVGLSSAYVN